MRRLSLILALTCAATMALAHQGVQNPAVMARMHGMDNMADQLAVMVRMVRGESAFDAGQVEGALVALSGHAAEIIPLFEAQESDPRSEARPEIWQDFAEFSRRATAVEAAISGLSRPLTSIEDVQSALRSIGATCQSCHDQFRIED